MDDNNKNQNEDQTNENNDINNAEILNTDIEVLKKNYENELNDIKDSYTRLLSELVNTKKNFDLDMKKSKQGLLLKIISIVDTYTMIEKNMNSKDGEAYESLKHVLLELQTLLATEGVVKVEINEGDDFDPTISEAISVQEGNEDGKVLAVVSPAYKLKDQIIRTAKLIVTKKSSQ